MQTNQHSLVVKAQSTRSGFLCCLWQGISVVPWQGHKVNYPAAVPPSHRCTKPVKVLQLICTFGSPPPFSAPELLLWHRAKAVSTTQSLAPSIALPGGKGSGKLWFGTGGVTCFPYWHMHIPMFSFNANRLTNLSSLSIFKWWLKTTST